jgi:hypothetical protein
LDVWAKSEDTPLRQQAARSFLRLVLRVADGQDKSDLLDVAASNPDLIEPIARLWQLVLVDGSVGAKNSLSVHAWQALADWLRQARTDERHAKSMRLLLRRFADNHRIQPRLNYWLSRGSAHQPRPRTAPEPQFQEI